MNRLPVLFVAAGTSLAWSASSFAVSLQTQHNEVANGAITIVAGDRTDWDGIDAYMPLDVDDVTPVLSVETVSVAHDSSKVFFRMQMDAIDESNPNQSFFGVFHSIYIDADQDRSTGYIGDDGDPNLTDGVLAIGADYLIQGPYLYRFGNLGNPGGANQEQWGWGTLIPGNMVYDDGPATDIEFEISRSQIGNPDAFDFFAITETEAFETQDVFPNSGQVIDGDYFTYSFLPIASELVGDYNDSGQVEQGDLDLVLLNWGLDTGTAGVPAGWTNDLPDGQIEQTELDGVLLNWGSTSAPDFSGSSVPEPASLAFLGGGLLVAVRRRG